MVRFGDFEIDEATRELRRHDTIVHLEPQAFDVLVHLVRQRDRVVPKQELLDSVWGHRFVSESALTTRIKEARRAVGDDGTRQAVIANVRGRGYRFIAPVDDGTEPTGTIGATPDVTIGEAPVALIGRDDDLHGVLDRLASSRLVCVVGPGGVGKTVLVTEVARQWRAGSDRAVRTVSLGDVAAPEAVVAALAEATGVMAGGGERARVLDALAGRTDLLVLDNCEHVVDEIAGLVGELLVRAPRLAVLATSRERLGLSAELVWPLLPLGRDDARRLFLERAEAALPGVQLPTTVADGIVDALDGLPLALEMAAGQISTTGASDLEATVRQRTDLLRAPGRAAPARHRTLDALVRWSLDLLDAPDRTLVAELTVFTGPTTAADAAQVLRRDSDPPDELALGVELGALCGRSLLAPDTSTTPTRYRMPEVVRAVASKELVSTGARRAVLVARHAHHQLEVAQAADDALRGPDERAAHDRLTESIPDLRAAHRWGCEHAPELVTDLAAALHLFAYSRLWGEPASWARSTSGPTDAVQAAVAAADAAHRSRLGEASELALAALQSDDPRARAIGLEVAADVSLYRGELEASAAHAEHLRRLGESSGDLHLEVIGLINLALSAAYRGQLDEATAVVAEMERLEAQAAPSDRAWCRYAAGEVTSGVDPAAAVGPLRDAIAGAESVGNRLVPCVARTTLATAYASLGQTHDALDEYATGVGEAIDYGNSTHAATLLRNLVGLLVDLGDIPTAATLMGALGGSDVKSSYGEEARRMADIRETLVASRSTGEVDRWLAEGAGLRLDEALRTAHAAIDEQRS
ncbi:MAG TPA: winged helix-turn-helix domain-containing protein [Acidimicrobiales bacterium]